MLRSITPRNAASKRALEKREPKEKENPKRALFLRGTSCSQVLQDCLNDLAALRAPFVVKFTKKNAIHPFEDVTSLEFFSRKNDASLVFFGNSQKKRPHCITFCRLFNHQMLDMLELYLIPETFRNMTQFKVPKMAVGLQPLLVFSGTAFESPVTNEFTLAKSLFTDFFRRDDPEKIDVEGLQAIVSISADEPNAASGTDDVGAKPRLHFRMYRIVTKRSGSARLPRVELEEMGPRLDFIMGRTRIPDADMLKQAMKQARTGERTKKNISTTSIGDKIGRIHLGKQDLSGMQTRKMKGLKRGRDEPNGGDEAEVIGGGDGPKKKRTT